MPAVAGSKKSKKNVDVVEEVEDSQVGHVCQDDGLDMA